MTDEGVRRHPAYMERSCRPSFNVLSRCNLSLPNRVKCQNDKQHFFLQKAFIFNVIGNSIFITRSLAIFTDHI